MLNRRILVVDDNADAAETLALLLRARGHEVLVAHDGPAALEACRGFRPEAALLDIGLPEFDGYELARRLRREHSSDLMLIALTGYAREDDKRLSAAAGFDHHLVKPVDFVTLESLLTAAAPPAPVAFRD